MTACAGSENSGLLESGRAASLPTNSLPPWPAEHSASALSETLLLGQDCLSRSAGTLINGTALELTPAEGPPAWALYGFDSALPLDSVAALLSSSGQHVYILLANYADLRWELHGPYSGPKTLAVDSSDYRSPGGYFYCAVLADEGTATLSALSIRSQAAENVPPEALLLADKNSGDAPLSVSFDASGSSDSDGEIIEYAWDWDGNGSYEEFSETAELSHVFSAPGAFQVRLRVTDAAFAHAWASLPLMVGVAGNEPPAVSIGSTKTGGTVPFNLRLVATANDPDGAVVRYDWDFDGDGQWDNYDSGNDVIHKYSLPGSFAATVRATDDKGAQALAEYEVEANAAPLAQLTAIPNDINLGETTLLDGSLSDDPDGSIAQYEWDTNGDGIYDLDSGGQDIVEVSPAATGSLQIRLRVTDNDGGITVGSAILHVHGGLGNPQLLDDDGVTGSFPSMVLVQGCPAISYQDASADCINYIQALDSAGANWAAPVPVHAADLAGQGASALLVVNGRPAISFYDALSSGLYYVRAQDNLGAAWGTPVAVDLLDVAGSESAMALVDGFPAVAYTKYKNLVYTQIGYVRALDIDGSAWGAPVILDSQQPIDTYSLRTPNLLALASGPAVAYCASSLFGGGLYYLRANDAQGADWPAASALGGDLDGRFPSLALVNGRPAMTFYDTSGSLSYVRADDALGDSWTVFANVGSANGFFSSLAIIGGNPAIAFVSEADPQGLTYIEALDSDGGAWGAQLLLDDSGPYPSLIELSDGHPAIAYASGGLKFIGWF